jgi:hypothetical protein
MQTVEVFKTNVGKAEEAQTLIAVLSLHFPQHKINVDLHDCDKVLRMEGSVFCLETVKQIVHVNGFACELLE